MNGKLISSNPRLMIRNQHSSELVIKMVELADEGQYECQTDETINYIVHLIVVNSKVLYSFVLFSNHLFHFSIDYSFNCIRRFEYHITMC